MPTRDLANRLRAWPVIGALALCLAMLAPRAALADDPMQFHLVTIAGKGSCPRDCADVISAEGEIDNDTADRLVSFLSANLKDRDLRPVVLLQSPGGTVVGSMQLGTVFRNIGAAVIVASARPYGDGERAHVAPGLCLSACVYAFIGGAHRVVPPESRLGIHRMVINEQVQDGSGGVARQQIFGSSDIVSSLAAYASAMGVSPGMIGYAETVAPEQLHIVTPKEITRWRLGRRRL